MINSVSLYYIETKSNLSHFRTGRTSIVNRNMIMRHMTLALRKLETD